MQGPPTPEPQEKAAQVPAEWISSIPFGQASALPAAAAAAPQRP